MAFAWVSLLALIAVAGAYPTGGNNESYPPMENPNLYQGDMLLDDSDRNAVPTKGRRWPGGIIPYVIDQSLVKPIDRTFRIRMAMNDIEKTSCVKFVPWDGKQKGHVKVFSGQGCYAKWGYYGPFEHELSLGKNCQNFGTFLHEMNHVLGFEHEQSRPDRDDYLIIHWDNIVPEYVNQFEKYKPEENWVINSFDYESIMLYGEYAFSKDRTKLKTMESKKPGFTLKMPNTKTSMTKSDIERINVLYDCPKK